MNKIKSMAVISLFTSLMCLFTMLLPSIPISVLSISVTLQSFVVMIAGMTLSPLDALTSMSLYILLGVFGLPVFSNMQSGPAILLGPTGGFIIAFPFAAYFISLFKGNKSIARLLIVNILFGIVMIYIFGIFLLSLVLRESYLTAAKGMTLFLIPDVVKAIIASLIGYKLKLLKIYGKEGK